VPVHAAVVFGVFFPVGPELVELALVVAVIARHVDHDEHAVGDAFGDRHLGTIVGANDTGGAVTHVFVPGSLPVVKMALDDSWVHKGGCVPILIGDLLREWELGCSNRS